MNEIVKINNDNNSRPTVMGRELHEALEIKSNYTTWFKRMCEYGFTENSDFVTLSNFGKRADGTEMPIPTVDHQLTIDMAKEICMIQRSEIGRKCRQYFIEVEKQWNSPETIMERALKYADQRIKQLEQERANAPISIEQLDRLKNEIRAKAIDLCGCGRVYTDVGAEVWIAIEDKICKTMNVKHLEEIVLWQLDKAIEICRVFKPGPLLRSTIDTSRTLLKALKGA